MLQLRCTFTICHPPRQGHPGIICNLSSPTLGPKVGLERTDHYATQYNMRTGLTFELRASLSVWVLDSNTTNPSTRRSSMDCAMVVKGIYPPYFTPVESRITWWPDFLFFRILLVPPIFYLLSSISSIFLFLHFNIQYSITFLFWSLVKTETKCLSHSNHYLGVFHHASKQDQSSSIQFKPVWNC